MIFLFNRSKQRLTKNPVNDVRLQRFISSKKIVSVILFGVLGDLFESKIKRSVEIKDSSDFLPGHGGVLDRVDSQILSFPILVLFIQFLDLI